MTFARLGLENARIPHADRYGLLWLERGSLSVAEGTLHFHTAGSANLKAGDYDIPHQSISMILLGPGTTISHDVFRLAARHGVGLIAVGEGGVRMYTAPPLGTGRSDLARRQAELWASPQERLRIVRKMYEQRLDRKVEGTAVEELRGMEGTYVRDEYRRLARLYGIEWSGREYDRVHPENNDPANTAVNHAAIAAYAAADIAVAAVGAIPQLGFIHESAGDAFALDIADIFRMTITVPIAFQALRSWQDNPKTGLERQVRKTAVSVFAGKSFIPRMIETIRALLSGKEKDAAPCR